MEISTPKQLRAELRRRRVVRAALYYVAAAWVLAQVLDLLLDAFEALQYMRFVVGGLVLGLPVATAFAWMFDRTPSGIERTPALLLVSTQGQCRRSTPHDHDRRPSEQERSPGNVPARH